MNVCHWEPYGDGDWISGCVAEIVSDSHPQTLGWNVCPGCGYQVGEEPDDPVWPDAIGDNP